MNAAESAVRHDDHEIARPMVADNGTDDVVDRISLAGRLAATFEVGDQLGDRQPFGLGELRTEHRRDQHLVSRRKGPGKVVLEDAATRGGRSWLEYRPEARVWVRGA